MFIAIMLHVLSLAALVVATAAALCAVVVVCRKLLTIEADHASHARLVALQRERNERIQTLLADKAAEGYEAEMDAIYYAETVAAPLSKGDDARSA